MSIGDPSRSYTCGGCGGWASYRGDDRVDSRSNMLLFPNEKVCDCEHPTFSNAQIEIGAPDQRAH